MLEEPSRARLERAYVAPRDLLDRDIAAFTGRSMSSSGSLGVSPYVLPIRVRLWIYFSRIYPELTAEDVARSAGQTRCAFLCCCVPLAVRRVVISRLRHELIVRLNVTSLS